MFLFQDYPVLAVDADVSEKNRNIMYALVNSKVKSLFDINASGGMISVIDPENIDSEQEDLYTLQVSSNQRMSCEVKLIEPKCNVCCRSKFALRVGFVLFNDTWSQ